MGVDGGFIKMVFRKRRSPTGGGERLENIGKNIVDKGRWSLSKLRFCRHDLHHAPSNTSTTFKSYEAIIAPATAGVSEESVTLPMTETSENEEIQQNSIAEESKEQTLVKEENPRNYRQENAAAIAIQSAFLGFQARRKYEEIRDCESEEVDDFSRASVGTSIEVLGGDSVKSLKFHGESIIIQQRMQHKGRTTGSRLKEEWDASTVSSNISKLRMQNRLEAMTRRERALAYAFSQQLRTCSTKKRPAQHEMNGPDAGWSWLETWMATSLPENSPVKDDSGKHPFCSSSGDPRSTTFNGNSDITAEEMESCGSNDVFVSFESISRSPQIDKDGYVPVKNRLKAPKSASRRKNNPSYGYEARMNKVIKRKYLKTAEKGELQNKMQTKTTGEVLHVVDFQCPHESELRS